LDGEPQAQPADAPINQHVYGLDDAYEAARTALIDFIVSAADLDIVDAGIHPDYWDPKAVIVDGYVVVLHGSAHDDDGPEFVVVPLGDVVR
jgi:hypothetical protein